MTALLPLTSVYCFGVCERTPRQKSLYRLLQFDFAASALLLKEKTVVKRRIDFHAIISYSAGVHGSGGDVGGDVGSESGGGVSGNGGGDNLDDRGHVVFIYARERAQKVRIECAAQNEVERSCIAYLLSKALDVDAPHHVGSGSGSAVLDNEVVGLSREIVFFGRLQKRTRAGSWKFEHVAVAPGKLFVLKGPTLDSAVRNALSLLHARICLRDDTAFDVITRERRIAYRAEMNDVRTMWLKALKVSMDVLAQQLESSSDLGSYGLPASPPPDDKQAARQDFNVPAPGSEPSSSANHPAPRLGLSAYYFFNFSVVQRSSTRRGAHERRIVHVDVERQTVEMLRKETLKRSLAIENIASITAQSDRDLEIKLKNGKAVLFNFDSSPDVAIFQETVQDLIDNSYNPVIKYPRNIERKSSIEKRGASGLFQKRYAVLIPGKLYIMRSPESYFPIQVFALGPHVSLGVQPGELTFSLSVHGGREHCYRCHTPDEAVSWQRQLELYCSSADEDEYGEGAFEYETDDDVLEQGDDNEVGEGDEYGHEDPYSANEAEYEEEEEEEEIIEDDEEEEDVIIVGEDENDDESIEIYEDSEEEEESDEEGESKPPRNGPLDDEDDCQSGSTLVYIPPSQRVGMEEEVSGQGSMGFDHIVTKQEAFSFWGVKTRSY